METVMKKIIDYLQLHPEGARFLTIAHYCGNDPLIISKSLNFLCDEEFLVFKEGVYIIQ